MKVTKEFQFGAHRVVLETGEIARQADGAVMVDMGVFNVFIADVAQFGGCIFNRQPARGHRF